MSQLLIRPNQHSEEYIVSYLIRIRELNGFRHIGYLLQHAGLPWKSHRIPTHQIITGEYDIKPYFNQSGLDYTYPRTASTFKASQIQHVTTKIFAKTPRICPKCISENGVSSDLWNYSAYPACIKHKVLLIDTSPSTSNSLSWYRSTLNSFSEEDPFPLDTSLLKASQNTLAFNKTIVCLLEGRKLPR